MQTLAIRSAPSVSFDIGSIIGAGADAGEMSLNANTNLGTSGKREFAAWLEEVEKQEKEHLRASKKAFDVR